MPITLSTFLIPSTSVPFLMEDVHMRGGFMVVADATARDALHLAKRKKGMIVVTQDDGKWWTIGDSINTFEPVDLAKNLNVSNAFEIDGNGDLTLAGLAAATEGQVLTRNSSGDAVWANAGGGGATLPDPATGDNGDVLQIVGGAWAAVTPSASFVPTRVTPTAHVTASLAQDASEDFTITGAGNAAMVLSLSVDQPDVLVECHETSARNSNNPYSFLSYTGHLSDDGTSVLEDQSTQYNRRYAFLVNHELANDQTYYFRVTNQNASPVAVTVNMDLLVLQP